MKIQLAKVIGHRGACGYAPENTMRSLSKAHELGLQWVEFDVMLARCGQPIIIHDTTLDRTTNGKGPVIEWDYQTMTTLDCGSWFSEHYIGEVIPTLNQLLKHAASLKLSINVEIKPYHGFDLQTAMTVLTTIESHWPSACTPPLISSFSSSVLKLAAQFNFPLGYIINDWHSPWKEILEANRCLSLHVDHKILTHDRIKEVKDRGYLVLAYTVNDPTLASQLFEWGVDSVFSDFPDKVLSAD